MKKINNTHFLSDSILSIVMLLVLLCISWKLNTLSMLVKNYITLSTTLLGIFATILGFLITAISVLLTIQNTKYILALRKTGQYRNLLQVFITTCYFITINLIFLLIFYLFHINILYLWIISLYLTIFSFVRLFSCIYILKKIIDLGSDEITKN